MGDMSWLSYLVTNGSKKQLEDFLKDKPEKLLITGYPDNKYKFGEMNCGGKIVKM